MGDTPFFRCPECHAGLPETPPERCSCGRPMRRDGILNFVRHATAEQGFYEEEYETGRVHHADEMAWLWANPYSPMNQVVLEAVGDPDGKRMLLLGNGDDEKELIFHRRGAQVVYSDYSLAPLRVMAAKFPGPIYAAIDAMDLPFEDEAIDVVYGYAFVHHLRDTDAFLREARRVLRPGGRAVFLDNPRSPLYQAAKLTLLRPLMGYYHRKGGISPEDREATLSGWHSEEELRAMLERLDVRPFFRRAEFLHYLVNRAGERLPPRRLWRRYEYSPRAHRALIRLDERLARFQVVRENQMRLVWGFERRQ